VSHHDLILGALAEIPTPQQADNLGRRAARSGLRQLQAGHGRAARSWLLISAHAATVLAETPHSTSDQRITWRSIAAHRARIADECREVHA